MAVLRDRDQHHAVAHRWQRYLDQRRSRIVTTEAALWELLNGHGHPDLRSKAIQAYRFLHEDAQVEVIPFQANHIQEAIHQYASRKDKHWGITDCHSFIVMTERGLTEALTADHHFVQAGFRALLLEEPPA